MTVETFTEQEEADMFDQYGQNAMADIGIGEHVAIDEPPVEEEVAEEAPVEEAVSNDEVVVEESSDNAEPAEEPTEESSELEIAQQESDSWRQKYNSDHGRNVSNEKKTRELQVQVDKLQNSIKDQKADELKNSEEYEALADLGIKNVIDSWIHTRS